MPPSLTNTSYKQNLNIKKITGRNLNQNLLQHIPQDTPAAGQYNENSTAYKFQREDIQIPKLGMYTPKKIGKTFTKQANYYREAELDSFDPATAHDSVINGISTSAHKKTIYKAHMDKYNGRDEQMYNTIDFKKNIELENTKEERAELIYQARERKRMAY